MQYDAGERLILDMVNILTGNQVDTETVQRSLQLICDGAGFDCGLIYEMDFSDRFFLMEHYSKGAVDLLDSLSSDHLSAKEKGILSRQAVTYVDRNICKSDLDSTLLDMFEVSALVLAPVVDENWQVYGIVLLLRKDNRQALSERELQHLSALVSMLVRYVGIRMYQRKFSQAKTALESVLDNTGIDIYVNDFYTHDILYVNKSMAAPYGGQAQFVGRKCWQVLFPGQGGPCEFCPQKKLVDETGAPTKVYTWDYERPFDGSWFRVFSAAFHWVDGRLAHVVSSADISDNKRNEAMIEYMANYDQLTGLPNRRMLVKDCEARINNSGPGEKGYILFFDIDGFKSVNDNFGHDGGDEFLIQLGKFFSGIPLLKHGIYRNGGDEFVAIIDGEAVTKGNIRSLSNFIHKRFQKPWPVKGGEVLCNISIGVACYPEDGVMAETLIQKADMSMYQVKKEGGGGLCFGYQLKDGRS